jgi:hypothetical protein
MLRFALALSRSPAQRVTPLLGLPACASAIERPEEEKGWGLRGKGRGSVSDCSSLSRRWRVAFSRSKNPFFLGSPCPIDAAVVHSVFYLRVLISWAPRVASRLGSPPSPLGARQRHCVSAAPALAPGGATPAVSRLILGAAPGAAPPCRLGAAGAASAPKKKRLGQQSRPLRVREARVDVADGELLPRRYCPHRPYEYGAAPQLPAGVWFTGVVQHGNGG